MLDYKEITVDEQVFVVLSDASQNYVSSMPKATYEAQQATLAANPAPTAQQGVRYSPKGGRYGNNTALQESA